MDGRLILRTVTTPYYIPAMNHGMMPGMPVYDEIEASNRHCCQAMGATIQTHGPGSQHKHCGCTGNFKPDAGPVHPRMTSPCRARPLLGVLVRRPNLHLFAVFLLAVSAVAVVYRSPSRSISSAIATAWDDPRAGCRSVESRYVIVNPSVHPPVS